MVRISLIGMSGLGKSHWSAMLAERGFSRFCCDDLITSKLSAELKGPDGSIIDLGTWMGFPYEPDYKTRESQYLKLEVEVLSEVFDRITAISGDVVVDTTGSVIYAGEDSLNRLRQHTTIVHFATSPDAQEKMLLAYMEKPRPVLWRDIFTKNPHETNRDALMRCYPLLLASRERLYRQYADVVIEYEEHRDERLRVEDLLHFIEVRTPRRVSANLNFES